MNVDIQSKISAHYPITADGNYQVGVQVSHPSIGIKILYGKSFEEADNQVFYFLNESDGHGGYIDQSFPGPVSLKNGDSIWVMTYLIPTIKTNNGTEFVVNFGVGAGDTSDIATGEAAHLKVTRTALNGTPNLATFGTFSSHDSFWGTSSEWSVKIDDFHPPLGSSNGIAFFVSKGDLEEEVNIFLVDSMNKIRGFWGIDAQNNMEALVADYPDSHNQGLIAFALVSGQPVAPNNIPQGVNAEFRFAVGDPEKDGTVKMRTV